MFYYTVYKITNQINWKIYIWIHKTSNLIDWYMGSWKHLLRAQKKYWIKNFKKEYLEIFNNSEDMFNMESKLVNSSFINRKDTYNIKEWGVWWFNYINTNWKNYLHKNREKSLKNLEIWRKFIRKFTLLRQIDGNLKQIRRDKISKTKKEKYKNWEYKRIISRETRKKLSEQNKWHLRQIWEKNSQFWTIWIFNTLLKKSKKIKKEEMDNFLECWWEKWRKLKF